MGVQRELHDPLSGSDQQDDRMISDWGDLIAFQEEDLNSNMTAWFLTWMMWLPFKKKTSNQQDDSMVSDWDNNFSGGRFQHQHRGIQSCWADAWPGGDQWDDCLWRDHQQWNKAAEVRGERWQFGWIEVAVREYYACDSLRISVNFMEDFVLRLSWCRDACVVLVEVDNGVIQREDETLK